MKTIAQLEQWLHAPDCEARLRQIYGSGEELSAVKARLAQLLKAFSATFGGGGEREAILVTAPGRTELGGNHTDHQRGKVLAASVNLDGVACASPNGSRRARILSQGYGMTEVELEELSPRPEERNTTASLVRGILSQTGALGYPVAGFDAYIISGVPAGSGLSSSACYEVLVGETVNGLFCGEQISLAEIARMGQRAENVYFGKPSGLMDQMACALGGAVTIDFRERENPRWRTLPLDLTAQNTALCIIDTGADHADLTDDYAAIPREMGQVAACFGKEVLSQVEPDCFYANLSRLREQVGDRAVLRAIHYFGDVTRVEGQVAALERGDFGHFLSLVNQSGRSSFMYLQNISTFRDAASQPVAVALAAAERLLQGAGAFRVHGGGFAGTIQAFVPLDRLDGFVAGMDGILGQGATKVLTIRPVGGAVIG